MTSAAPTGRTVELLPDRVAVNGQSRILLCASLFYFRIPRAYWRERMEQLVSCGYNAIDVYFPWNYHEPEEGVWEFEGEKDAAAFLALAAEAGLWVVARPGPYICSEWDGGALPAYLRKYDIRLRDNDPAYLGHVARWFDRILPLLRRFEAGRQGTIIAVQLDNELDFYGCKDPQGYIRALRDMALAHGISVPLFACAGQGGLTAASGDVPGVAQTCNFYPDNRDPALEAVVLAYRRMLETRGWPLLVTETNRSHFLLRRLLSCGVKLLGPYLQVSGTDFGFTNATNNWGRPLAFMTSDYDFGGMISPEGHVRPEAYEGKLLRRILDVYGTSLAEAKPVEGEADGDTYANPKPNPGPASNANPISDSDSDAAPQIESRSDSATNAHPFLDSDAGSSAHASTAPGAAFGPAADAASETESGSALELDRSLRDRGFTAGPHRLSFPDGGTLAFVSDLSRELCLALPERMPLRRWGGIDGEIAYATAELFHAAMADGRLTLLFCAEETASDYRIALRMRAPSEARASGAALSQDAGVTTLVGNGSRHARCEFDWPDGSGLRILAMPRGDALRFAAYDEETGNCTYSDPIGHAPEEAEPVRLWHAAPAVWPNMQGDGKPAGQPPWPLEQTGIYRGFAYYEADSGTAAERLSNLACLGVLAIGASDVVSVYADQAYVGTVVPGGASRYLAFPEPRTVSSWSGRIEIWGHSNFEDIRLPGLRLDSRKGVRDLAAVLAVRNWTSGWRFARTADAAVRADLVAAGTATDSWPMTSFGGWHPNDPVAYEYYRRTVALSEEADAFVLHFDGLQSPVRVYVDGSEADSVRPEDPWLTLTPFVRPGGEHDIVLLLERRIGCPAGRVQGFECRSATNWRVAPVGEAELAQAADQAALAATGPKPAQAPDQGALAPTCSKPSESTDPDTLTPTGPQPSESTDPDTLAPTGSQPTNAADQAADTAKATQTPLPCFVAPGESVWLTGVLADAGCGRGWRVHAEGANGKLTVLLGSRLIARLWLPGGSERPVMSGGSPDSFYVPGAWIVPDDPASRGIRILLEAVVPGERGELRRLTFRPV